MSFTQPGGAAQGATMPCPKCGSTMLPMQRFEVTLEQCSGCSGIFLDRGELEQLMAAEARFYAQPPTPPGYTPQPPPYYPEQDRGRQAPGGFLRDLLGGSTDRRRGGHGGGGHHGGGHH
ncbi:MULTISPECIES: zf-TFIIB domain-containing protein [Paenarthrobacter]|nr:MULTISPECIES: zf-TFIIB domain-containing protein [Paenarthrobacter]MDO5866886.1 zf-TFIIB domain-containing protein [Paenarthrobacter sp. SD-2]UYV95396.1 zf-TFIIB domain-containing protein [Paenarthrobacter ureafaciens]